MKFKKICKLKYRWILHKKILLFSINWFDWFSFGVMWKCFIFFLNIKHVTEIVWKATQCFYQIHSIPLQSHVELELYELSGLSDTNQNTNIIIDIQSYLYKKSHPMDPIREYYSVENIQFIINIKLFASAHSADDVCVHLCWFHIVAHKCQMLIQCAWR